MKHKTGNGGRDCPCRKARTYRVTFDGVQGRIGQGKRTVTIETERPTAVQGLAERRAGLNESQYRSFDAIVIPEPSEGHNVSGWTGYSQGE